MVFCVGIFIMGMSCSKSMNSDQPKTDQKLTGEWTWIQSTFGNSIINPAGTGIQKKLNILSNGDFSITHNDSTYQYAEFQVYITPLLPKTIVDSRIYQIVNKSIGCTSTKIDFLVVDTLHNYQYAVSNDSLYIMNPPCLAPHTTIYIKTP
jgi:hypothetical protein